MRIIASDDEFSQLLKQCNEVAVCNKCALLPFCDKANTIECKTVNFNLSKDGVLEQTMSTKFNRGVPTSLLKEKLKTIIITKRGDTNFENEKEK